MRNVQVGNPEATDVLAKLVPRITYKPTWTFELHELSRGQGCEGLTLCIGADVQDSFSDQQTSVLHLMPVPAANFTERDWLRWILDCVLMVEQHEALEFFRLDGDQPYFPGHAPGQNPYTIVETRSRDEAHAPAIPWSGGPPTDPAFADYR